MDVHIHKKVRLNGQIFIAVIICILCNLCSAFHESFFNGLEEIENVQIKYKIRHRSRRHVVLGRDHEQDLIYTEISGNDVITELKFRKIEGEVVSPVFSLDRYLDNVVQHKANSSCVHVYEGTSSSAHAHAVVDRCDVNGDVKMIAEVVMDNGIHVILPKGPADPEMPQQHGLYRINNRMEFLNDDHKVVESTERNDKFPTFNHRFKRQTDRDVVELMFIIDYSLYQFWYALTNGTSFERETTTMDLIQRMYTFLGNGVRMRYENLLPMFNIDISIKLTNIYVLKTAYESSFTEGTNVDFSTYSRGVVDAFTLLTNFETWISDKKAVNPQTFSHSDHYTLLTAREIELSGNAAAGGYAYYSEICTSKSLSIAEDKFNFLSTVTAAHELGHSLGGVHDGVAGVASCRDTDGYILSAINAVYIDSRATHPWKFSSCSADAFAVKLKELQESSNNCLRRQDSMTYLLQSGKTPGQEFSPDRQCELMIESDSVMWRQRHLDALDQICTGMACTKQVLSQLTFVIPGDGTSCGDKKWCWNGQCVHSEDAPSGDERCFFGDQSGAVIGGNTCEATLSGNNLWKCYQQNIQETCCATCSNITGIEGCEFGNVNDCSSVVASQCYNEDIEKSKCCETCFNFSKTYENLPSACKYGDRKTGCVRTELVCEQFSSDCCETCAGFRKTTSKSTTTTVSTSTLSDGQTQIMSTETTRKTPVTPENNKNSLPSWVIPVAAGVGGFIVLTIVIGLCYNCLHKGKGNKYNDAEKANKYYHDDKRTVSGSSSRRSDSQRRGSADSRARSRSGDSERRRSHDYRSNPKVDMLNSRRASADVRRTPRY